MSSHPLQLHSRLLLLLLLLMLEQTLSYMCYLKVDLGRMPHIEGDIGSFELCVALKTLCVFLYYHTACVFFCHTVFTHSALHHSCHVHSLTTLIVSCHVSLNMLTTLMYTHSFISLFVKHAPLVVLSARLAFDLCNRHTGAELLVARCLTMGNIFHFVLQTHTQNWFHRQERHRN